MTPLTSFAIALCAVLTFFFLLMIYDMRQEVRGCQDYMIEHDARHETEARPLVIQQRYGHVEVYGEEVFPE